jgi:hypothetical protein
MTKLNKTKTQKNKNTKTEKNIKNKNTKTEKNIKNKNKNKITKTEKNTKTQKNKNKKNKNIIQKKYIDGPCEMYYYSNLPNDRKLLIFGENHFTPNSCNDSNKPFTSIVDYLKEIAKKSSECVDIYIENDYKNKELTRYDDDDSMNDFIYLNQLRREFMKCDDKNKSLCKYKNARIHFSDPRVILETDIIDTSGSIDNYIRDVMNGSILTMPELYLMRTNLSCDHYRRPTDYPKFKEVIKFLMGWKREEKYKLYYFDYISYITEGYSFDGIANSWCEKYFQIIDKEKKKIKHFSIEKIYKTLYKIYENYYETNSLPTFEIRVIQSVLLGIRKPFGASPLLSIIAYQLYNLPQFPPNSEIYSAKHHAGFPFSHASCQSRLLITSGIESPFLKCET